MIPRAITATRPIYENVGELRSIQSMITEANIAKKSNQNNSAAFQSQTQPNYVSLDPNINNAECTESLTATEVTGISIPTSSTLISGFAKLLQDPTKTIRSNCVIHSDPNASEKFASQDNSSVVTSHQIHIQNTANLPSSQFIRTRRNIPM